MKSTRKCGTLKHSSTRKRFASVEHDKSSNYSVKNSTVWNIVAARASTRTLI